MNREILFKAKTTKKHNRKHDFNDVWVEGDLVRSGGKYYIHPIANKVKIDGELGKVIIMHEVDQNTICQFTGLTDKNGKKIWENDIIKFNDEIWDSCYTSCGTEYDSWEAENYGLVGYCDYSTRYDFTKYKYNESQVEADLHENHDIEFSEFVKEHEVIGNIFDNAELLEVK
ncbi:MAG: YopX family protein [Coprococcus sp.]